MIEVTCKNCQCKFQIPESRMLYPEGDIGVVYYAVSSNEYIDEIAIISQEMKQDSGLCSFQICCKKCKTSKTNMIIGKSIIYTNARIKKMLKGRDSNFIYLFYKDCTTAAYFMASISPLRKSSSANLITQIDQIINPMMQANERIDKSKKKIVHTYWQLKVIFDALPSNK